ncbi:MAG: YccF domain-containing protein [Bradyrhizobium sp.]
MQPVSILLNVLWILIGGAWMAFGWLIAAVIMAITIIGLPWARAAFNIAVYTLLPFGSRAVRRDEVTGMSDLGTGPLGVIGNLIWFILAGWWLALGHLVTGVILCLTIIGIPFGIQSFKLAALAMAPLAREIVSNDDPRAFVQ